MSQLSDEQNKNVSKTAGIKNTDDKPAPQNTAAPALTPLYTEIVQLLETARAKVLTTINTTMTQTYYQIGKLIVENEQNGKSRAEYGKETLKNLSKQLTEKYGKDSQNETLNE
ncbi:MAG: DUF1016 N-terminal domain-containing protein [Methanocorpusculum sp.]|nr:DUF1016 N-terminal domain-containing protein [Methanocorpusculum sp.]